MFLVGATEGIHMNVQTFITSSAPHWLLYTAGLGHSTWGNESYTLLGEHSKVDPGGGGAGEPAPRARARESQPHHSSAVRQYKCGGDPPCLPPCPHEAGRRADSGIMRVG